MRSTLKTTSNTVVHNTLLHSYCRFTRRVITEEPPNLLITATVLQAALISLTFTAGGAWLGSSRLRILHTHDTSFCTTAKGVGGRIYPSTHLQKHAQLNTPTKAQEKQVRNCTLCTYVHLSMLVLHVSLQSIMQVAFLTGWCFTVMVKDSSLEYYYLAMAQLRTYHCTEKGRLCAQLKAYTGHTHRSYLC